MNKFYNQQITVQWLIAIVMLTIVTGIILGWYILIVKCLWTMFLIFIITPICQFCISPLMKLAGVCKYLFPMLFVYSPSKAKYDLHICTSFEYFLYKYGSKGTAWQNILLQYYLEGLLRVLQEVEENKLPDTIEIRGSSYFLAIEQPGD